MLKIFAACVALFLPAALSAQAFGVQMGAPVSRYGGVRATGGTPFQYRITVPQPNSEFDFYNAWAFPETGVCKVTAFGKDHANDSYGYDTRNAFRALRTALASKYGKSSDFDYLHARAVWDKPNEWVWSIFKKERTLESFWTTKAGSSLPSEVSGIDLDTNAVTSSAAYLTLSYEFSNIDRCLQLMENLSNSGL